jgi:hypothetical protein
VAFTALLCCISSLVSPCRFRSRQRHSAQWKCWCCLSAGNRSCWCVITIYLLNHALEFSSALRSPAHIALGAILHTLADILNTFSATVLPFMQDGVLAAATTTSHSDRHVRSVSSCQICCIVFLLHFLAPTPVITGLRRPHEGRGCLRQALSSRLLEFNCCCRTER